MVSVIVKKMFFPMVFISASICFIAQNSPAARNGNDDMEEMADRETVVIGAAGAAAVRMDELWGCTDGTPPSYDADVCWQTCWERNAPESLVDSRGNLDRGAWSGTFQWCEDICAETIDHPDSAYAKCLEFIRWKEDPQAGKKSWSFSVRHLSPKKEDG